LGATVDSITAAIIAVATSITAVVRAFRTHIDLTKRMDALEKEVHDLKKELGENGES